MSWREESEKFSLSFNGKLHLKFLGKSYWSPCNFEKAQVALGWPNWDTNFIARLRMHFYRSESTLGSLKSVLNVFRGKSSLGAPEWFNTSPIFNSPLPEQSWQLLIGVQRAKLITRKKNTSTLYFFRLFMRNKFSLFANKQCYFLSRIFYVFFTMFILNLQHQEWLTLQPSK